MTCFMASILKKTIRGRAYYYARECRRVAGKPTIVWQKYLGRADDIIAALVPSRAPGTPTPARPREAIIRCVAPCSKARMARWFEGTALRRLTEVRPQQLTSQRFWDHMARVSPRA